MDQVIESLIFLFNGVGEVFQSEVLFFNDGPMGLEDDILDFFFNFGFFDLGGI